MTDKRRRDPGPKRRAFWALTDFFVPKAGDKGQLEPEDVRAASIRVERVSATGKTVWVRFTGKPPADLTLPRGQAAEYPYWYSPEARRYLALSEAVSQLTGSSRAYLANGTISDSPPGRLRFR